MLFWSTQQLLCEKDEIKWCWHFLTTKISFAHLNILVFFSPHYFSSCTHFHHCNLLHPIIHSPCVFSSQDSERLRCHGNRHRHRSVGGEGVCVCKGEIHLPSEPGHVSKPGAPSPSADPQPERLLPQRLEEQQQPALLLQGPSNGLTKTFSSVGLEISHFWLHFLPVELISSLFSHLPSPVCRCFTLPRWKTGWVGWMLTCSVADMEPTCWVSAALMRSTLCCRSFMRRSGAYRFDDQFSLCGINKNLFHSILLFKTSGRYILWL